ncbi:MAG: hypothetical protein ABI789_02930 [Usitatibacter sp.]
MSQVIPLAVMADNEGRARLELRMDALREAILAASAGAALRECEELHLELERFTTSLKWRLFASALVWTQDERQANQWMCAAYQAAACLELRAVDLAASPADDRVIGVAALALHHLAEALKSGIAIGRSLLAEYRTLHDLMKRAIDAGRHREPLSLRVDGRQMRCCVESLYFRALLMARFAGGNLNCRQVEIFDAWLWQWMSVLESAPGAPPGAELRVDLDSSQGLWRGPRAALGVCLYLPHAPMERAFQSVVTQFHRGHLVPSEGLAAGFRIEEHIGVLDLLRRGLRQAKGEAGARAERQPGKGLADVHVGIAEIAARAFLPLAPRRVEIAPQGKDAARPHGRREADDPTGDLYLQQRRRLLVRDVSISGFGLEGLEAECAGMEVGDLLAIRRAGEPLALGKVVRIASSEGERIIVGVERLPGAAMPIRFAKPREDASGEDFDLVFVSGDDDSGRHDAFLVSERLYAERWKLDVAAEGDVFGFRFNRVRERGRAWVLAGFEIVTLERGAAAAAA